MLSDILRWGGKRPGQPDASGDAHTPRGGDTVVPSKALPKFLTAISHQSEAPVLIDLGPVIGANVSFFGEELGCKLFIEDLFDYLSKPAAQALAKQIVRMLRPGGSVMGFFCTSSVDKMPFTKYEIVDKTSLRHKYHAGAAGPKHAFLNRDIIKMFDGLIVSDSFLLKNNTREILLRRKS